MLRDVSRVDTGTEILGQKISFPVCVGVTALHKLAHSDGESATARGENVTFKQKIWWPRGQHACVHFLKSIGMADHLLLVAFTSWQWSLLEKIT